MMNKFSIPGANITQRIGNGDVHFHRSTERVGATSNQKLLDNIQKKTNGPLDIETGFTLDKFGKKMTVPPKDCF